MEGKHPAVLLIDSDAAVRTEVGRLLSADGAFVVACPDCESAFQKLATQAFDATVVNVTIAVLPGSGPLLQLLRDHPSRPCIFVSPAGELWLSTTTKPEQAILRGTFGPREFATCIADAVRKVLLTSHLISYGSAEKTQTPHQPPQEKCS